MINDEPNYSIATIRKLLEATFTPESLHQFCHARSQFQPVLRNLRPSDNLPDQVDQVIVFCQNQYLFDELLAEIATASPGHYAPFASGLSPALSRTFRPPPPRSADELPEPGELPPGSRLPFHRNPLFSGRIVTLTALLRTLVLNQTPATLITQAVQGRGGVGKTQVAIEFAYRYGRYFRGVHWLNASQPDLIGAEIALCGAEMNLSPWPQEQSEQMRLTLQAWQEASPRLVILDNLEDVEAAGKWLPRLQGGGVRLLLTARRTDWPQPWGLEPLRLKVFAPAESLGFLRKHLAPTARATIAELKELTKRLGYLPMALELARRYLEHVPGLTVPAFLGKLDKALEQPAMNGWLAGLDNPTGPDLDLAAALALSWEQVESESARRVFSLAAYCASNQPIPCELLEQAAELDGVACGEALRLLAGLGLLAMEVGAVRPTIHPLLAEYGRALSESVWGKVEGAFSPLPALAASLSRLAAKANQRELPAPFGPLRPHLEAVASATQAADLEKAGVSRTSA